MSGAKEIGQSKGLGSSPKGQGEHPGRNCWSTLRIDRVESRTWQKFDRGMAEQRTGKQTERARQTARGKPLERVQDGQSRELRLSGIWRKISGAKASAEKKG